jgi:hypothetical protein
MLKEIVGYPNYSISDDGYVINKKGLILSPSYCGRGYKAVALCNGTKPKTHYIHRLVAEHFIPNPELKKTVNHIDGVRDNNSVDNLEWNTYSENNMHAIDSGLRNGRGEKHYNSKLTESIVRELKKEYSSKNPFRLYADKYGVSKATIRDVIVGNTWVNV